MIKNSTEGQKRAEYGTVDASLLSGGQIARNEADRLNTLSDLNIMDSPPDERFDRVVRLATAYFGMPVCKITLVGKDRNWYKACAGISETDTPRSNGICSYAILSDEPLVVPDLTEHPRFRTYPADTENGRFRFYAGAPIILENGVRVGSFCLMDTKPHPEFGEEQVQFLTDLAQIVAHELILHRDLKRAGANRKKRDALTGLLNAVSIEREVQIAIDHPVADAQGMAVLYVDIDDFGEVNNDYGKHAGDLLLKATARRLEDLAGQELAVGRISGDKFLVMVKSVQSAAKLHRLIRQIQQQLSAPVHIGEGFIHPTVSIGVALGPPSDGKAITFQRHASWAIQEAKSQGINQLKFFSEKEYERNQDDLRLATDLRNAIANNELELYYQPFVDLKNGRVVGYEALLRWHHPEKGMIMPGKFIPIAEETRQICALGTWALNRACEDAVSWNENLFVSVNLSPLQFKRQDVTEVISAALAGSGLPSHRLEIEITESALIDDFEAINDKLRAISNLGVTVTLDDFGTGYCNLNYLVSLKIDKLKIDKAFIGSIERDDRTRTIVAMITNLSRYLNTSVVAEGVELPTQHEIVRMIGCDIGQGFLYGKPQPKLQQGANRISSFA
nr:GGDEF domain-containing protein [uncultured Cohaesibacter sp.]